MGLTRTAPRWMRRIGKYASYYVVHPQAVLWRQRRTETADGLHMWCHSENLIERSIIRTGQWEPWESAVVKTLVRPGTVALDIGANIGYFTLLMAHKVGVAGQVHAFEPTQYAYERLQENLKLNPQLSRDSVKVVRKGLLAEPEQRYTAIESRFSGRMLAHSEPESIEFTTVDVYREEQGLTQIDFIKIDVDGHDHAVMQGASETLKSCRPLVLAEFYERVLADNGSHAADYMALYQQLGYDRALMQDELQARRIEEVASDPRLREGSHNILLIPEGLVVPEGITAAKSSHRPLSYLL